jgi:hypothetical protein
VFDQQRVVYVLGLHLELLCVSDSSRLYDRDRVKFPRKYSYDVLRLGWE